MIGWNEGLSAAPQSLKLLKTVELSECASCIFHHEGITYVGMIDGMVMKIDSNHEISDCHQETGIVYSIAAYKNSLITLVSSYNNGRLCARVNSYQLLPHGVLDSGSRVQWAVNTGIMCVVASRVIVMDNAKISVYSLAGEIIRQVPNPRPRVGFSISSLCAAGKDSIVVCDRSHTHIYRVNIDSGDVLWTSDKMTNPIPMNVGACNKRWLLVASKSGGPLGILSLESGMSFVLCLFISCQFINCLL